MFASKDLFFTRPSGYQISRSVRLRSSATAYLNRTFSTPTNNKIWTWSGWIKRGKLGVSQHLIGTTDNNTASGNFAGFRFTTSDSLEYFEYASGYTIQVSSNSVFRDPSGWYHIVIAIDTTQATAANRTKFYVNGVAVVMSLTTSPALNYNTYINSAIATYLGAYNNASLGVLAPLDGYMTEVNFIDGQQLTPSSFGETNAITGVWQPKKYAGTYGTNGFYLNFSDNSASTAATIGKDYSGNGNNWTPNNISVTAGTTYDSMLDSPTPYADGGNGRGNYSVWNPIRGAFTASATATFTDGNLKASVSGPSTIVGAAFGSLGVSTGKWYWETTVTSFAGGSGGFNAAIGITNNPSGPDSSSANATTYFYTASNGKWSNAGSYVAYGATYTTGDVIGIAFDADAGSLTFYKNNTSQGVAFTGISSGTWHPMLACNQTTAFVSTTTFGQQPFTYTPPTGYVALNTQNLSTPTIANGAAYMAATTYTGTGASLTIANTVNSASFQPDWVWVKGRSGATDHALYDSVRGTTLDLVSNSTAAETTQTTGLTAFGSTGFTVGALAKMNTSAATYVGWQWKAGTTSASNTSGTITSTVSVGATQGFSIATFTAQASGTGTVGHGLGVAPSMIIMKQRAQVGSWGTYHISVGNGSRLLLDTTAASVVASSYWNNTSPTSTVFTLGTAWATGGTMVAYCFSAVAGYSAFGSYTGNGSTDGPFVYLGFRPRFLIFKRTDTTGAWFMEDSSRGTYNVMGPELYANLSDAETTSNRLDFLSNGFKLRAGNAGDNASGGTYIYMAFAENPFKYSLAR